MTFQSRTDLSIPAETIRVARAAFPKGNAYMKLRDELGVLYQDARFMEWFSKVGQPGEVPGLLAIVSIFQFMEGLSDRQTADCVRGRIDWKYALGLELTYAGFEAACFQIDWAQQFVICPQAHKSQIGSESHNFYDNPVIHVRFAPENCQQCPCRSNCTRSQNGPRALKLRTQKQHEALQQARTRQKTDPFKQLYKKRAGVEGTISQGVRTYGLRSSRYIGQAKTHLQNIISAVAMNLVRLDHWFNNIQPAITRTSAFATLAPC